ncbi:tetratricopeptide repeat protein [Nonomuraea fuscirosea]|uniref:tetratricopeptide repeat protein n=1 Tax=Nonomuraea fuscirosea TaxID=1291556 RepID=UPI002DDA2FA4|nr:tetratricopeptide repeat protein [Nonomuraea fuscirosea]WSA57895.1 tetratricopeptide repeat protein [Nonomuraea fuscirosea]
MKRGTRLAVGSAVSASLTVAAGVAINQILDNERFSWWWLLAALAAALVYLGVEHWRGQPDPAGRLKLSDQNGLPPIADELPDAGWGIHLSSFLSGPGPHIRRPIDEALRAALTEVAEGDEDARQFLIVEGERLAGTTHALARALTESLPGWRVTAFVDDQSVRLPELVAQAASWITPQTGVIVWLDAITVDRLSEFTAQLITNLPRRLVIAATVHTEDITDRDGAPSARLDSHVPSLLDEYALHLNLGVLTSSERDLITCTPAYAALRPALHDRSRDWLIGRLMISLDHLRQALTLGRGESDADRVALLHAVTDWQRAQMPPPLTKKTLLKLWRAYRRQLSDLPPRTRLPEDAFTRALEWATAQGSAAGPQLITRDNGYQPHPLLALVAAEPAPTGWAISTPLWAHAERCLDEGGLLKLGQAALDHGNFEAADRLLLNVSLQRLESRTMRDLADQLMGEGRLNAARTWYLRTIEGGHDDVAPRAMATLGLLERVQDQVEEARTWLLRAAESGHDDVAPRAMATLGALEEEQGQVEEARTWYLRSIEGGHDDAAPRAMAALGGLEGEQGRVEESRTWYLRAAESGHEDAAPIAMVELGVLERVQGRVEEARVWLLRAAESGHDDKVPKAMAKLGMLEREQGRMEEARTWYLRAAESGHDDVAPGSLASLGELEYEQGQLEKALVWFLRAAESGHDDVAPEAMANLGVLEREQGRVEEARTWLLRAAESGHDDVGPRAMADLGRLEGEQGQVEKARAWIKRAAESGHDLHGPEAMISLAVLEYEHGRMREARAWFLRAADSGHDDEAPRAMANLGVLEYEQGRLEEARTWFLRAKQSGNAEAAARGRGGLRELDRHEEESRKAKWMTKYGDFYGGYRGPDAS